MTQQLGDEEEKAKSLAKQKAKQEAVIADLEERLRNAERVMMEIPTRCAPHLTLERFSNDCGKTKTKAIASTNHNGSRQRDEPITILSNYL